MYFLIVLYLLFNTSQCISVVPNPRAADWLRPAGQLVPGRTERMHSLDLVEERTTVVLELLPSVSWINQTCSSTVGHLNLLRQFSYDKPTLAYMLKSARPCSWVCKNMLMNLCYTQYKNTWFKHQIIRFFHYKKSNV